MRPNYRQNAAKMRQNSLKTSRMQPILTKLRLNPTESDPPFAQHPIETRPSCVAQQTAPGTATGTSL
eukprot:6200193-Pleurochrysis_carterae.AAC.2